MLPQCVPAPLKSDPHAENPILHCPRKGLCAGSAHATYLCPSHRIPIGETPELVVVTRWISCCGRVEKRRSLAWDQAFVVCTLKPPLRSRHTSIGRARGLCRDQLCRRPKEARPSAIVQM